MTILIIIAIIALIVGLISLLRKPMKLIWKLLLNSIVGFVILYLVNLLGGAIGLNIPINWISALVAGTLGLPGVVLLAIVHLFL